MGNLGAWSCLDIV
jgi:hypothetical protein